MTVTLNENAIALGGIVQPVLDVIGKVRVGPPEDMYPPPTRLGAPNGLGKFWLARVSTTRQGVMGTNTKELGRLALLLMTWLVRCHSDRTYTL